MRRQWGGRLHQGLLAILATSSLAVESAQAATPCTASGIMAVEPACPNDPAQPCRILSKIEAPSGGSCAIDFSGRDLVIGSADGAAGSIRGYGSIDIRAQSLTVFPNGSINGRGDGADGANLFVKTSGAVDLKRQGVQSATIDVSGAGDEGEGGVIEIEAGDTVTIDGVIRGGKQLHAPESTSGNEISIISKRDIIGSGQILDPSGVYSYGDQDHVSLDAMGKVDFAGRIDVSGYAGSISVTAVGGVRLHDIDGAGDGIPSFGAYVEVGSEGDVNITGDLDLRAIGGTDGDLGGNGGALDIRSTKGSISISGDVRAGAIGIFGIGGGVDFYAATDVRLEPGASLSLAAGNNDGYGGVGYVTAERDVLLRGSIDASGKYEGGEIEFGAGRDMLIEGDIDAGTPAGSDESNGGSASFQAGKNGTGHLFLGGHIDVNGGGCLYGSVYGGGGFLDLGGCDVTIGSTARLRACGRSGGYVTVTARRQMSIAGEIDAPNVGLPGEDGMIMLVHVDAVPPQTAMATFSPAPTLTSRPPCNGADSGPCLVPCPECGDGIVEYPETCDTQAPPESCDGCSFFCRSEEAGCDDGKHCTVDSCHPVLGCEHERLYDCYDCQGDVDNDGAVDADDIALVAAVINKCNGYPYACSATGNLYAADFDYDRKLTAADLTRMIANRLDPSLPAGCAP